MDENNLTALTLDYGNEMWPTWTPQRDYEQEDRMLRYDLITLLAPMAAAAGATTVEDVINSACKIEKYIKTGVNPLTPMIAGHDFNDGPINSDVFEIETDEPIYVDEQGVLQYA